MRVLDAGKQRLASGCAVALALLVAATAAVGATPVQRSDRWGLGLEAGFTRLMGGERAYSNTDQYGALLVNRGLGDAWTLQFAYRFGHLRPGVSNPGETAGWSTKAGAPLYTIIRQPSLRLQRHLRPSARFSPWVGGGLGLTSWKVIDMEGEDVGWFPDGDPIEGYDTDGNRVELKRTEFTLTLAGGVDVALGDRWTVNGGARLHFLLGVDRDNVGLSNYWGPDHVDANTMNPEIFLGGTYWFGSSDDDDDGIPDRRDACPRGAEDIDGFQDGDGCPDPDNDQDGVLDLQDACPDEPEDRDGFADNDGCPDPDNDRDGVLDAQDRCPDEAEDLDGYRDEDGCPDPDNDGDGVLDVHDRCPGTTAGARVDSVGCEIARSAAAAAASASAPTVPIAALPVPGQTVVLGGITFTTASARLATGSGETLDALARALLTQREALVEIRGHTDAVGDAEANRELSARRAAAVRDALVQRGVPPERLRAVGYGEDTPRATNDTPEGRALNRRVELHRVQ